MELVPPLGYYLLVRRGSDLCAIKFTGVWRGNDASEPTAFHGGEESYRLEYDWHYMPDFDGKWPPAKMKAGHSQADSKALVGIGRFAFQTGKDEVFCGPVRLSWSAPSTLAFGRAGKEQGDYGYEMAVTKWKKFDEIRPDAPYLKWYRYDVKREVIRMRVDELW